ncbi:MAG: DNA polymerase III subunit delta' [Caulobacteraceae bacterium]
MSDDVPHPRDAFDLIGNETAERAFAESMERGRLHHAWLLAGPPGLGKANFAYRAARRLLGAAAQPSLGILGSRPDDPVSRQIAGRAHPDLLVIQRLNEDGRSRRDIPVEEVRQLGEFFAKSPAQGGARVAIVDDADHLNEHGVNALLKVLEEPPPRGILFLVCATPGRLLPTVRSRCRRLRFLPPEPAAAAAWVAARAGVEEATAQRLLAMAGGAPGRAWRLALEGAVELDAAARDVLARLPRTDEAAVLALADSFRGPAGAARFNLFFARLAVGVGEFAREQAAGQALGPADGWAGAFAMLSPLPRQAEAINLDRTDILYVALSRLAALA